MKTRSVILWSVTLLILGFVNYRIYDREQLAVNGQVVLLELAPVDPRSLMQGDYMRLRYGIAGEIENRTDLERGQVVVQIDSNSVAHFVRIYSPGSELAENEILLPFRGKYDVNVGPESFFFQEGHADYYDDARYGELRISEAGSILLVGLRDENFRKLSPPE